MQVALAHQCTCIAQRLKNGTSRIGVPLRMPVVFRRVNHTWLVAAFSAVSLVEWVRSLGDLWLCGMSILWQACGGCCFLLLAML